MSIQLMFLLLPGLRLPLSHQLPWILDSNLESLIVMQHSYVAVQRLFAYNLCACSHRCFLLKYDPKPSPPWQHWELTYSCGTVTHTKVVLCYLGHLCYVYIWKCKTCSSVLNSVSREATQGKSLINNFNKCCRTNLIRACQYKVFVWVREEH